MGFVAGTIATLGGTRTTSKTLLLLSAVHSLMFLLYIGKSYLQQVALGSTKEAIVTVLTTKAITSCINAVVAIIVSVALYHLIAPALKKANLFQKK